MAYNLNKSPQPFGGNKATPPPIGLAPSAPRMSSIPSSADAQLQGPVTRRQLLSPAPHSPQSSPCPSPVVRLRPHSIALSGTTTTTNPLQTDHPAGSTSPSRSQGMCVLHDLSWHSLNFFINNFNFFFLNDPSFVLSVVWLLLEF